MMTQTGGQNLLRLFAAVELSEGARRAAAAHAAGLRESLQTRARVSWERAEKMHLTLKFFGGVEAARAGALSAALSRAAAGAQPFGLRLETPGVFPSPARPAVLWLGLADDTGRLAALRRVVEEECAAENFPRERRDFRPHVTVARVREATAETRRLARLHLEQDFEPVAFEVCEIVLMSSRLEPAGSVYTPLSKHSLG